MSEDTKQPDTNEHGKPDESTTDSSGTTPASAIRAAGTIAGADAEKAAMVEQAKTRVAAVKESLESKPSDPTAPGAPKPPVKKKEEGPKPTDASAHPLVKKLRATFDDGVIEASEFLGQLSIRINRSRIVEVCNALRNDAETPFNYLSDLTCAHYPDHKE